MKRYLFSITVLLICFLSAAAQENNLPVVYKSRHAPVMHKKILDLSFRNLKDLPIEAEDPDLEVLILDNNNLDELPNSIANLKNLKILSVRNNRLKELNPVLSFCGNLEQIYLSGNPQLRDIPSLPNVKLIIIDATDTGIHDLPGWVEMADNLIYFKYSKPKQ
jgi:Leucine-rich repeat (LRR) protein